MYGGALTAGALTLSGGTLTTNGGGGSGDSISAPLTNNGTVTFAGTLHTLTLTGDYTQGSAGTLIFRVANGATNDVFTISGGATLAGTLTITAIGTLTAGQTWDLILAGVGITTDFTTKNWPDGGNWIGSSLGGIYFVTKT